MEKKQVRKRPHRPGNKPRRIKRWVIFWKTQNSWLEDDNPRQWTDWIQRAKHFPTFQQANRVLRSLASVNREVIIEERIIDRGAKFEGARA